MAPEAIDVLLLLVGDEERGDIYSIWSHDPGPASFTCLLLIEASNTGILHACVPTLHVPSSIMIA